MLIMSVKNIAVLLWNGASTYLLFTLFLTSYLSTCEGSLAENINISRDENSTLPETTTLQGTLQGINMVTRKNRTIFGFLGVPYAEPPVDDLRFKAPVAAGAWNGTFNASTDSEPCPQFSDSGVLVGKEDCLYLNVYTPQLPASNNSALLPVMVYIVGGRFKTEIIAPDRYSPEFLLDKDVVLLLPNFRVGVLGYLSTGDEVSPGNYGLKDAICALQWIQDNIQYFGGDPNQVTLFGGSAGGMSVHLLALSDLSIGLFHRYISQSGTALSSELGQPREVFLSRTTQLAEHFGCPTNSSTLIVNCLRGINASELVDSNSLFYVWRTYPDSVWLPTIEPDFEGALLTDTPRNLVSAGKIRDLPWLISLDRDEGLMYTIQLYEDSEFFEDLLTNIDLALPYILGYWCNVDDVQAYTDALKEFYLPNMSGNRSELLANMTNLMGDGQFIYAAYSSIRQQLALAKNPQYFALFSYRGTVSYSYYYSGSTDYTGVVHADEIIYLLGPQGERLSPAGTEFNEADWLMVDKMVQMWTSFATNGTPITLDSDNVTWEPYSARNNYLRIGNGSDTGLGVEYDLYLERMQFWDELTEAAATPTSGESRYTLHVFSMTLCLCSILHILYDYSC